MYLKDKHINFMVAIYWITHDPNKYIHTKAIVIIFKKNTIVNYVIIIITILRFFLFMIDILPIIYFEIIRNNKTIMRLFTYGSYYYYYYV
jgi:hypothetical protein